MKRSLLVIIALLFTTVFGYADFEIETGLPVEELEYIKNHMRQGYKEFEKKISESQEYEFYIEEVMEKIYKYNINNEKQEYAISYLNSLLKEKYFSIRKKCFDKGGCYSYTMTALDSYYDDSWTPLENYNENDIQFILLLDMLFYSYMKYFVSESVYGDSNWGITTHSRIALEKLQKYHGNYDNYNFYLGRFAYIIGIYSTNLEEQQSYLDIYEKLKDEKLNREENLLPIHIAYVCGASNDYYCSKYTRTGELIPIAYPNFYFQEHLPEGYY